MECSGHQHLVPLFLLILIFKRLHIFVSVTTEGLSLGQEVTFKVNHSFVFMLKEGNIILFIGVYNPEVFSSSTYVGVGNNIFLI